MRNNINDASKKPAAKSHRSAREAIRENLRRTSNRALGEESFSSYGWKLLLATYTVIALIFLLVTPYTFMLDEIKNLFLLSCTPFLLATAVYKADFSKMSWKTHASSFLLGLITLQMVFSYLINPYKAIGERVVWFQVACMTFTVVFAWFMNSENKMRKTMMFFVLLSLASVAIGLFLFAGQGFTDQIYQAMEKSPFWQHHPEWITLFQTFSGTKQMYSTILNEDFYAAYLVMMLPISLAMFFVEEHLGFKVMAFLTFVFMNVCLFFCNSNDSYMSVVLITYPLFILLGRRYVKSWNISRRVLITVFLGALVVGGTAVLLQFPTLARTWAFKAAALDGRKILWMGGVWPWLYRGDPSMHHLNFLTILFGTGPGGYRFYFPVFRSPVFFDNQINNVTTFGHNYYIDMACEFGLVGLLLFLGLYATVFYNAWQQIRSTSNRAHQLYQIACVCGLAGVALQNSFSPNNRWAVCGMTYYALFGLSMGIYHLDNPGREREVAPARREEKPLTRQLAGWALAALVAAFALRSVPQGLLYYYGAVANLKGRQYMDTVDRLSASGGDSSQMRPLLEEARKHLENSIWLNPTFTTSYYKLAHVYNQLGRVNDAIATYEQLRSYDPHYSEIHLNLGIMYSHVASSASGKKQLELMEKAYAEMKEAARQEWRPYVQWTAALVAKNLATLYTGEGKKDKAAPVLEDAMNYYQKLIDYKPMLPKEAQDRKERYVQAQEQLVELARQTNKLDRAEKVLQQRYHEDPANTQALEKLLGFYDAQGKTGQKVAFLESAVHGDPMDVRLRTRLAQAYAQAGNSTEQQRELKRIEILKEADKPTSAPR